LSKYKIFISYRREDDGAYFVPPLSKALVERYGVNSVFYDIDNIPLGSDFRVHLQTAIDKASIVLVVIGERWMGIDSSTGKRRIDEDKDFVRIEVEAALIKNKVVIPVLVARATMPSKEELPPSIEELAFRNAAEVRTGRDHDLHMNLLFKGLDPLMNYTTDTTVNSSVPNNSVSNMRSLNVGTILSHIKILQPANKVNQQNLDASSAQPKAVRPADLWPFPNTSVSSTQNKLVRDASPNTNLSSSDAVKHEALITGLNGTEYRVLLRLSGQCQVFVAATDEQVEAKSTLRKYILDHQLDIDCEMPINTRVLGKRFFAWHLKNQQS